MYNKIRRNSKSLAHASLQKIQKIIILSSCQYMCTYKIVCIDKNRTTTNDTLKFSSLRRTNATITHVACRCRTFWRNIHGFLIKIIIIKNPMTPTCTFVNRHGAAFFRPTLASCIRKGVVGLSFIIIQYFMLLFI